MLLPLLLWCVPATTAQAPAAEDLLASTLAAAREAHGHGELRQASLRASGRSSQFGQQGSYTLELHRDGAFRNQVDSSLPQTLCGDDHQGWQADWSGHRWPLEFLDLERARLFAAVLSGRWLDAEPPLTVTLASESTGAALELRWRGGSELAHLVLSADSQRVERLEVGGQTWHFEDYRDVEGFPFPHRLRSESTTAPTLSYELDAVQRMPDLSAAQVLREPASAADARFDPAVPVALELHRAPTGHLLARARLGADHEGWFILDTGAGALCLSPRVGTELDFPALGAVTAAGVSAAIPARILRGGPLVVGPLTLEHPTWVELDLDFLEPHFGVPVSGVLGFDLFARAVVTLDRSSPRVELHAPGAYRAPEGLRFEPLLLQGKLPCLELSFEGERRGVFRLDTGANGSVLLHHGAVQALDLLAGRTTRPAEHGGVGGMRTVERGELAWLEFGGRRFGPVEATFETRPGGQSLPAAVVGTLGGDLLEPFVVVFDYPQRRVAFLER